MKQLSNRNYVFQVYDECIDAYVGAEQFLMQGRNLLMSSEQLAEDRLALAKVESADCAVILYVDRDEFQLVKRTKNAVFCLCRWQLARDLGDRSMGYLESMMARYLWDDAPAFGGKHRPLEFWELGEEPAPVRELEDEA